MTTASRGLYRRSRGSAPVRQFVSDYEVAAPAVDVAPMPEPSYFLDNYGRCSLNKCECLKPGNPWLGRGCRHWVPNGSISVDGLMRTALAAHHAEGERP